MKCTVKHHFRFVMETKTDKPSNFEKRAIRRSIRALHTAIRKNELSKVQELLTPDIDINFHYDGKTALQIAVTNGYEDICRFLIKNNADVNKKNTEDDSLLNMAVWRGHLGICKLLVDNDAELDICNDHGNSALNTASHKGYSELAEILVQAGCDIDCCNSKGQSPLLTSARKGHHNVSWVLIEGKCDLNYTDYERQTALILAAEKGNKDVIDLLVKAKCDLDAREKFGRTALFQAAQQGHKDIVDTLVNNGAKVNLIDNKGNSPLMEAVKNEHLEIVRCLTAAGCDVNLQDLDLKQAAIHSAVRLATQVFGPTARYSDLVQTLLTAGCDVSLSDAAGWTPLYQAAFGGESDITELLLRYKAPIDCRTDNGNTLLHAAVISNKLDIVEMMLNAGCSLTGVNDKNETAIYTVIKYRAKIEILDLLIQAGSPLDICETENGQTALFAAIQMDQVNAVESLIKAGCNVNKCNYDGDTPLWQACHTGNVAVVQRLLGRPGVDIDAGLSHIPLHAAALHGHMDIANLLLEAGADVNKLTDLCVSAIYLATDRNHDNMVKLLARWGADPSAPGRVTPIPGVKTLLCCKHYRDAHPHLELEPLYAAVKNDNFHNIKTIVMATPRRPYAVIRTLKDLIFRTGFAAEARLSQTTVYKYGTFFTRILQTPGTLQSECRGVIRQQLFNKVNSKVPSLPLPNKLKEYILYEEGFV